MTVAMHALAALAFGAATAAAQDKPNILSIWGDDVDIGNVLQEMISASNRQ